MTSGPSKRERFTSCRFLLRIAICLAALILAFGLGFGLAGRKRKQKTVSSSSGTNEEASSPISTPTGSPISAPITSPINSSTSPPTPFPITSPPASVKVLLTPLVLTPEEFENHWTVQAQALDSLEQDETIQDYSPERLLQRYVLKVVYISTNRRQTDASDAAYGLGNFGPWREPR